MQTESNSRIKYFLPIHEFDIFFLLLKKNIFPKSQNVFFCYDAISFFYSFWVYSFFKKQTNQDRRFRGFLVRGRGFKFFFLPLYPDKTRGSEVRYKLGSKLEWRTIDKRELSIKQSKALKETSGKETK